MRWLSILLLTALSLTTWANEPETAKPLDRLTGAWRLLSEQHQVNLQIFDNATFHVDVATKDGIEVEGHVQVTDSRITFINDQGTDAQSADPSPGVYNYALTGDRLTFIRVQDSLQRRAAFLQSPWVRER